MGRVTSSCSNGRKEEGRLRSRRPAMGSALHCSKQFSQMSELITQSRADLQDWSSPRSRLVWAPPQPHSSRNQTSDYRRSDALRCVGGEEADIERATAQMERALRRDNWL